MIEEFGEPYHDATNNHSPEDRKMLYVVSDALEMDFRKKIVIRDKK
jgi:hypothetical protein